MEAKGSITRITYGDSLMEAEDNYNVYTETFSVSAGGNSSLTADGQTIFGNPHDLMDFEYFIKGYWTNEKGQIITKAYVGNTVTFNIETKNIPDGGEINISLYDYHYISADSYITIIDSHTSKTVQRIKVHGNKAIIEINIGTGVENFIDSDWENKMRLYVECTYKDEISDMPLGLDNYLQVSKTPFPLKIHQRSFAPWPRFGNIYGKFFKDTFHGDNRGFSLADNFEETPADSLENRNKKLSASGKVTSTLCHEIDFDYENNHIDTTRAYCNMTQGYTEFIASEEHHAIQTPDHEESYGDTSIFGDDMQKGCVHMQIWGSDPLVFPAPNIHWTLNIRLTLDEAAGILHIKGLIVGKMFPAYEAYIEDFKGKCIFLHTFMPSSKYNITSELVPYVEIPDYIPDIDISLDVAKDDNGNYYFGNTIKNGLFIYTVSNNAKSEVKTNLTIEQWNQLHLSKSIPKEN